MPLQAAPALLGTAGHDWLIALFPLGAACIAAVFGIDVAKRFVRRHRTQDGLWAVALFMFAAASLAMFLGVARGWEEPAFRVYWLLGAVLTVPYLAQGELYLLLRRRPVAHAFMVLLVLGTGFAVWKVWTAPMNATALQQTLPLGKEVFGDNSAPYRLSQLYAFPAYFLLLGGTVWSAWGMRGRPELRDRTAGLVGIAVGATIVAVGSGVGAGFGNVPVFSIGLALGIAVMYWGFLRASGSRAGRRQGHTGASRAESPPTG